MEIKTLELKDISGGALANALVYIYSPGTKTIVAGIVDGAEVPMNNPFRSGANGEIEVGAPEGEYDLVTTYRGRTYRLRLIFGPSTFIDADRVLFMRPEARAVQRTAEEKFLENGTPGDFGAVEDGVADDRQALIDAQSAAGVAKLEAGKSYNFGTLYTGEDDPDFIPEGRGELKWNNIPLNGYSVSFDIKNASIYSTPDSWFRATRAQSTNSPLYPPFAPPGRGAELTNIFNTVVSQGSKLQGAQATGAKVTQVTAYGSNIGLMPIEWLIVDAIGQDAMMFAQYAERCSAHGSENMVWAGATSQQFLIDTNNDWYRNIPPNEWTAENNELEAATPGIGIRIFNFNEWATSIADFGFNNTLGRDAGVGLMVGSFNNLFGYSAGGSLMKGSGNTFMGHNAGRNSVFSNDQVLIGMWTGNASSDGERNVFIGNHAGRVVNGPARSVVIGYGAARNASKITDSVIIGHGAADAAATEFIGKYVLANGAGLSSILATGNFTNKRMTIAAATYDEQRAPLQVKTGTTKSSGRTGDYPNALLVDGNPTAELVLEATSGTGFSTIRMVGHDGTGSVGEINYSQSGQNINFIANGASRWRVMGTGELRANTDNTNSICSTALRASNVFSRIYTIGTGSVQQLSGAGTPEGAITAVVGSTFQRSDGGALTSFYVKETGSGNTGWVAK